VGSPASLCCSVVTSFVGKRANAQGARLHYPRRPLRRGCERLCPPRVPKAANHVGKRAMWATFLLCAPSAVVGASQAFMRGSTRAKEPSLLLPSVLFELTLARPSHSLPHSLTPWHARSAAPEGSVPTEPLSLPLLWRWCQCRLIMLASRQTDQTANFFEHAFGSSPPPRSPQLIYPTQSLVRGA